MANIPADVTVETLKETLVLRGSASTSYESTRRNTNRVFNLKKATGLSYALFCSLGRNIPPTPSWGIGMKAPAGSRPRR